MCDVVKKFVTHTETLIQTRDKMVVVLKAHGYKKKLGVMTVVRMVSVLGILTIYRDIQGMVTFPKIGTILGMVTVLDIVRDSFQALTF